jgi:ligand-binding sensor domain-containing protein/DNA-binding CsgD family transcriptional regulator
MNKYRIQLLNVLYIILLIFPGNNLFAQVKSIGLPDVQNFTTEETLAGNQTWDIIEDARGNVYFGNNSGIVKFDGETWETIPISNGSIVRSLALGSNGKIYVGGYTEIGVLEEDSIGRTVYRCLNHLIPEKYRSFDDVWRIYQTRYGVIFQSFEYLFIMNGESVRVIQPETRFDFSYYVNNNFYVVEKNVGLRVLQHKDLETISSDDLFTSDEIRFILPYRSNDLLIGSFSGGIYTLRKSSLSRWNTKINEVALNYNIYNASRAGDQYVFGTVKNGLYITDLDGNPVQHMNRLKGLQNNTVLCHYHDARRNIWLGLDNGIDYLKVSMPLSFINYNFNIETVYTSVVFEGILYVGTNQGLFAKSMEELSDPENIEFDMVTNTEGQVWSLFTHDGDLFCGHNRGAYIVEGTKAEKISESRGVWNFFRMNGVEHAFFSGTYDGIIIYEPDNRGRWRESGKIDGFDISSRRVVCDPENNIWINHDYEGLIRLSLSEDLKNVVSADTFSGTAGLSGPLPYSLHLPENEFFVSTHDGNYTYDAEKKLFIPSAELNTFFSDLGKINFLKIDSRGNRWYISQEKTGLYRLLEDGTYTNIFTPFEQINKFMISNYEHIYVHDYENIFISSRKGLIHYDPTITKDFFSLSRAYIKRVDISSRQADSVWLYKGNKELPEEASYDLYRVPYDFNTLRFTFTCPDPENTHNIQYSYRLKGFSEEWSEWNPANAKEYTNLHDGRYTFEVRAKNVFNNISETDMLAFTIETPFYRSTTARIIYLFMLIIILTVSILLYKRRIEKVRSFEKEKHTAAFRKKEEILKEERLKAEREVERLRIEKLEANMKYKNKELANSTYHIIRKNKFLNALKSEISTLSKAAKSEFVEQELKKISRKIDRDINNEKNWEVFDRYFDEVHQEFLFRLKEKHPDLSPKELRLSAYLRMNISTKEIAPLMNISIRGVEISRYRLRKKLNLDRDENLTQYLMDI